MLESSTIQTSFPPLSLSGSLFGRLRDFPRLWVLVLDHYNYDVFNLMIVF